MERSATATLVLSLTVAAALAAGAQSPAPTVPLLDNLGSHTYPITTRVPMAQRYFDQGLRLYYGFNHAEAIRAFQEATRRYQSKLVRQTLEESGWNVVEAARRLDIARSHLYNLINAFGIERGK